MRGDGVWEKVTGRETDRAKTRGVGRSEPRGPGNLGSALLCGDSECEAE